MKSYTLINDGSHSTNWGLRSTTDNLKSFLDKNSFSNFFSIDQLVITRNYKFDPCLNGYYILNKNSRLRRHSLFSKRLFPIPLIADDYEFCANEILQSKDSFVLNILDKLRSSDFCIFNGEGSCYRQNYSAKVGLFFLWFSSKYLGKKSLFINGSVALNKTDCSLHGYFTNLSDQKIPIFVRDNMSRDNLLEHNINSTVVPDFAFLDSNIIKNESLSPNLYPFIQKRYVVISKSMFPFSSYSPSPFRILADTLYDKFGLITVFIGIDPEDQILFSRSRKTSHIYSFGSNKSYAFIEALYKGAFCSISGRYHHCIFSLKNGCPTIPLSTTSPKIDGLMLFYHDIYEKYGLSISPFDSTSLLSNIDSIVAQVERLNSITGSTFKEDLLRRLERLQFSLSSIITEALAK